MRRNIELKMRCDDLNVARQRILSLPATFQGTLHQIDTYFRSLHGRLKLREITSADSKTAELIWYDRPDAAEYRDSNFIVMPIADAAMMKTILTAACGIRGEVRKRRELYLLENVRIHFDEVEGLGSFIEFEAQMDQNADEADSLARLRLLHETLGVHPKDHVQTSYSDLLGI
jgi:predicted adenylyl cyclase CyaB